MFQKQRFRERLLVMLADAATLPFGSKEQNLKLNEAGLLLWRFDDSTFPLRADDLRDRLESPLETWLPKTNTFGLTGCLMQDGQAAMLAHEIIAIMEGNALRTRDNVIRKLLAKASDETPTIATFRNLIDHYPLKTLITPSDSIPDFLREVFYEPVTDSPDRTVVTCSVCAYPLERINDTLRCSSNVCSHIEYSSTPPHLPIKKPDRYGAASVWHSDSYLKLRPLWWRTIALPLLMERRMMDWAQYSLSSHQHVTCSLAVDSPGVNIHHEDSVLCLEPTAITHTASIWGYYNDKSPMTETWIVVPKGDAVQAETLARAFKRRYTVVTERSFVERYLFMFHGKGTGWASRRHAPYTSPLK